MTTATNDPVLSVVSPGGWHLNFEFSDDYEWDENGVLGEGKHDQPAYIALGKDAYGENGESWTYASHGRIEVLDEEFLEEASEQNKQALANAYLLASAKDLYIALRKAEGLIDTLLDGPGEMEGAKEVTDSISLAFKKASGEWHDVCMDESDL